MMARALEEACGLSLQALATPRRRATPIVALKPFRHSSKRTLPHAIPREAPVGSGGSDRFFIIRGKDVQDSFYFREDGLPRGVHSQECERMARAKAQPRTILVHERLEAGPRGQCLPVEAAGDGRRAHPTRAPA